MILEKDGSGELVGDGSAILTAVSVPDSDLVELHLEDLGGGDGPTARIQLRPWEPSGFHVCEWRSAGALVIAGAERILVLESATLATKAAITLEYEEGETLVDLWYCEKRELKLLTISSELHVWCLDDRLAIRWCWSSRTTADDRRIWSNPTFVADALRVPVRTMRGDRDVDLSFCDGAEA